MAGTAGGLVTVDLDATIAIAHSEKEQAAPTWKKTFGFHPLAAFADHGAAGNGEPLAIMPRTGGAGSNTAADHIETTRLALAQLPRRQRRRVLVRTDSAGGTHSFLEWLTAPSRRLHYSVGVTVAEDTQAAILKVPADSWTPAYDGDGRVTDGAWVADITGMLDLSSWPAGMRVIVRKERPHPGAQLRFTDIDGHRFTASPPTPGKGSSRTSNCGTAAGPAARTGSAMPKTPGCVTSRCTALTRTSSGASWWPWPANYWPGCRCSPWMAPPAPGNPSGCGCACSP